MLEDFYLSKQNIPKNYLKLSYPVHGNGKVLVGFDRLYVKKYYSYEIKYRIELLLLICATSSTIENRLDFVQKIDQLPISHHNSNFFEKYQNCLILFLRIGLVCQNKSDF